MKYFANPTGNAEVHDAMRAGILGFIDTPNQGNRRVRGDNVAWCADNGCFGKNFDVDKWWRFLQEHVGTADSCVFATAPDVVGDAAATLVRSLPWLPKIRALGYPAALVAQDGLEHLSIPWDDFDCLFIGGTTAWKMSAPVRVLVAEANQRGKYTHFGRVNSLTRFRYAAYIGCDSCDGTYLTFGPTVNFPNMMHWIRTVDTQHELF